MSEYSSIILSSPDLKEYYEKERRLINAINEAAQSQYFSILDVYRCLGYRPGNNPAWYGKETVFPRKLICKVMKSLGCCSLPMKCGRASTVRYYKLIPGTTAAECVGVCL